MSNPDNDTLIEEYRRAYRRANGNAKANILSVYYENGWFKVAQRMSHPMPCRRAKIRAMIATLNNRPAHEDWKE